MPLIAKKSVKFPQPEALTVEQAYEHCRQVIRHHAKSFYFAARFLPVEKRRPVFALYAFCRQVDDEIDEAEIGSENEAVAAVESWKAELDRIYADGEMAADAPAISLAWHDMLRASRIKQDLPLELIKGVLMDTHINRYETWNDLYLYCYRVASVVGLMSCEIMGYTNVETLDYAESLGIAMQLTNILRDVKEDAAMGRIYLPQEDLRKFGVTEEQIFESRFDNNFCSLAQFEIARAREYYARAEKGIAMLDADSRFTVLVAARLYAKILREIEKQGYNVFLKRARTTKAQKIAALPGIWLAAKQLQG
jgi:phytoene synthase